MKSFTIGVDYGTNSVRAVVVDCSNGREAGAKVFEYPSGHQGILLDPADHNLARQNPADYVAGLEATVTGALAAAKGYDGFAPDRVIGIGVDTTGSTPIPVDAACVPLAMNPAFEGNLNAQAWLWKDHTSAEEAARITALGFEHRPHFLAKCGETYSSEWFWSKIWHCLNADPKVFDAAHSWVECADYIPAVLAGVTDPAKIVRGVCAAGHKCLYCDEWGGLPDKEFLAMLDPKLAALRDRLFEKAHDGATPAGSLCDAWATKLGLPAGIPIAVGAIDAHLGAVGAGVRPGVLVKIMGTSTCDCTVAPNTEKLRDIPGICGIVDGSILPGHYGLEAGQSAVGDIFKWFVEVVCQGDGNLHLALTNEAAKQKPGQSGLLALDWNNGNRCLLVDPKLTGLLLGQTLYTTQADIYRALIEATAFGARAIIERYKEYGVPVDRIVCCGGIAEKNPMLMQIYADITGCTMQVSSSDQTCALGSALSAAVIAGSARGGYDSYEAAQQAMTGVKEIQYSPDPAHGAVYDELYALYMQVHDAFGGVNRSADLSGVMKALISIKERQKA
ncbi:MAG: ribulokinase [Candidatus Hydrogenedentes bacterium]|nr:ribulokinase [Candidatus Hydrogenedentota bacterium]